MFYENNRLTDSMENITKTWKNVGTTGLNTLEEKHIVEIQHKEKKNSVYLELSKTDNLTKFHQIGLYLCYGSEHNCGCYTKGKHHQIWKELQTQTFPFCQQKRQNVDFLLRVGWISETAIYIYIKNVKTYCLYHELFQFSIIQTRIMEKSK